MTDPDGGIAYPYELRVDAYAPAEIAGRVRDVGVSKANLDRASIFALAALSLAGLAPNLVPVTLGNVLGGSLLVGAMYWFVYLRGARS